MIELARSGAWLTGERMRVYCAMLLVMPLFAIGGWIFLSNGMLDALGRPIGTDFSNVWNAGRLVLSGEPWAAYDPVRHYAEQQATFGVRDVPFYGWHYPPMFLMVAGLLALVPYPVALAAWMGTTLPLYVAAVRAILPAAPRLEVTIAALAFPAVFVNLSHGQNGFLTAGLIGLALALLDRRPLVAGVLIGALAYKPQFGVLIPLVLMATGRWRAFMSAAITVIAIAGASLALFGVKTWEAFQDSLPFTRTVVLEAGNTGWEKIQSAFSAVRHLGGGIELAYAAQGLTMAIAAACLVWLWRSQAAYPLKAAGLIAASVLATPYVLDYDLMALAPAIAFMVAHGLARGFKDWEITALAFVWATPLVARTIADATLVPLGLIATVTLFALALRRARADLATGAAMAVATR
jgi:hypothetical protein